MNANLAIFTGNLVREPLVKVLPNSGITVTEITVAVNRSYKGKDGEFKKETAFLDCVSFDSGAEYIGKNFTKGDGIFIQGSFRQDRWTTSDGQNRSKLVIRIDKFSALEKRNNGNSSNGTSNGANNDTGDNPDNNDKDNNEVPF